MQLYMADSRGNILHCSKKNKLTANGQKEKLEQFRSFMQKYLQRAGIQVSADYFDMMLQPVGEYDSLLYFSKLPIDSSAKILKQKIAFHNGEYTPKDNTEKYLLNSIFETCENGKVCWYLLQAEKLLLQRNMFDNEWIAVRHGQSVPYYQFGTEWKSMIYKAGVNENPDSFIMLSGRNYNDRTMLIQTAQKRDILNMKTDEILSFYQKRLLSSCDIYSNEKTGFLYQLYQSQPKEPELYHAFQIMKKILKQQTGRYALLHYKGNDLIWCRDNTQIRFHVCRDNSYSVGGLFYGTEQLRQQLQKQEPFPQKEWYQSLLPFFAEQG